MVSFIDYDVSGKTLNAWSKVGDLPSGCVPIELAQNTSMRGYIEARTDGGIHVYPTTGTNIYASIVYITSS